MLFLTKIWIAEHPIDRPRSRALAGPPAMDMCAPSKGFFTDGEAGLEERVRLPRFLAPRFGSLRPIRRNLPNRVLKGSGSAETERVLVDVSCEVQGAVQQVQGSAQAERVRLRGDSKRVYLGNGLLQAKVHGQLSRFVQSQGNQAFAQGHE